jgi:cation diffusion facilitator CzcD-associated flavoprotein CzcO
MSVDHVDVLIIGAGLSGIGAGHQLRATLPGKTYTILEARDEIGGTWSLFQYPGVRSDSDMHTLGYRFRPWTDQKSIADGRAILDYVRATAKDGDVERHIQFGKRAIAASWSSADGRWTVDVQDVKSGEVTHLTCGFLFSCAGYYRYDEGYTPEFAGREDFEGPIIHPQHWPEELDYTGKQVVVIGSGATAVTVVPAMTDRAEHVTMLQRSPTYVVSLPGKDPIANTLRRFLPEKMAYSVTRWKNVLLVMASYIISRRWPHVIKNGIRKMQLQDLTPEQIDEHFTPTYNPWDQRMCVVPDGDLFNALKAGKASIVTDHIDRFTKNGILLKSGQQLPADIIVTATGLNLLAFGGIALTVDGDPVNLPDHMTYKAIMLNDVPNFVFGIGYTNASWTLKIDLTYDYLWKLLKHMDATGATWCVPRLDDPSITPAPMLDFSSGYVTRSIDQFPRAGSRKPWSLRMNYIVDRLALSRGSVDDGTMEFGRGEPAGVKRVTAAAS